MPVEESIQVHDGRCKTMTLSDDNKRQRPRALDLFCGAGGASMGLHRAGFDVTGVDIKPQPRYPFAFILGDALTHPLEGFDFIWASPVCQKHVKGLAAVNVARGRKVKHADFIAGIRERLIASGVLYAIENVPGSPLLEPFTLCGSTFGLPLRRHRKFECPFLTLVPNCAHSKEKRFGSNWRPDGRKVLAAAVQVYGTPARGEWPNWKKAMDVDWMTREELSQAIPPAYSEFIGRQAIEYLRRAA